MYAKNQSLGVNQKKDPKDCLVGATGQAGFDPSRSQRDVPAFRARSWATICNAARYINNGYAFLNVYVNNASTHPYKQSGVHQLKRSDLHFV